MKLTITDIRKTVVYGVRVSLPETRMGKQERYFQWEESTLTAKFHSNKVSGGMLSSWHHALEFQELEYHEDEEMFYFFSGNAIMVFADICDGEVVMDTLQAVRIPKGTQLIIEEGKGHFVAIAEDDEPVHMIVVAPKMPAPRIAMKEKIEVVQEEI